MEDQTEPRLGRSPCSEVEVAFVNMTPHCIACRLTSMRVLILQPDSEMYGACRSLLRTLVAMGDQRPQVTTVFPYDGPAVEAYRKAGIDAVIADLAILRRSTTRMLGGRVRLLLQARSTARQLSKRFPDVDLVHANSVTVLTGIGSRRNWNAPLVWQLREAPVERGALAKALGLLLKRYATRVAAISQAAAELVPPGIPVSHTPNGYARQHQAASHEPCGRPRVGLIARLLPTKGQDVLLRAMAVASRGFDVVMAGSPYQGHEEYALSLRTLAEKLGISDHVQFAPYTEPVEPLLDSLDLLVVATTNGEGFSTIALESLAAGTPVIAAASGGITELVDETCGAVAPVNDPAGLARVLDQTLERIENDGQAMSKAARKRAQAWSLEASADALLNCWIIARADYDA